MNTPPDPDELRLVVSGRALIARIFIVTAREHTDALDEDLYTMVRRDLCGVYRDHELDELYDAGLQPEPMLSPEEMRFVFAEGPALSDLEKATDRGEWLPGIDTGGDWLTYHQRTHMAALLDMYSRPGIEAGKGERHKDGTRKLSCRHCRFGDYADDLAHPYRRLDELLEAWCADVEGLLDEDAFMALLDDDELDPPEHNAFVTGEQLTFY